MLVVPVYADTAASPPEDKALAAVSGPVNAVNAEDADAVRADTAANPPEDKAPKLAEVTPVAAATKVVALAFPPYTFTVHVLLA
jgi:hypothetical protein